MDMGIAGEEVPLLDSVVAPTAESILVPSMGLNVPLAPNQQPETVVIPSLGPNYIQAPYPYPSNVLQPIVPPKKHKKRDLFNPVGINILEILDMDISR